VDFGQRSGAPVPAVVKIAIVLGPFHQLPPTGIGAVEKVWNELAQAISKAGHEVLLVGKAAKVPVGGGAGLRTMPLKGYTASASIFLNLAMDFLYSLEVNRRLESAEVIVTNSFWMPVVLAFFSAHRGRVVVHVARFPKGQMWLYRRASVLQAISSPVAAEIIRQTPSVRQLVRTLPYPVDLDIFKPPQVARTYSGELTVLYVGRVHPEKGLEMLIHAFRRVVSKVPDSRLRIVGPTSFAQGGGGADWFESLRRIARGLPVEFADPICEPAQLALELQRAHCFCYPSLADKGEAFGLSVLEAMATGLPVAVSALGCFGDFLEAGVQGLVFDHRAADPPGALSACLLQLLSEPQTAIRLGKNAADKARKFGLDKVAEDYISLFEEVAGN